MSDIEAELGMTRDSLIRLALLLGSDYTEGVGGIGVVNAVEVVHAFRSDDELRQFRNWVDSPDPKVVSKMKGVFKSRGKDKNSGRLGTSLVPNGRKHRANGRKR